MLAIAQTIALIALLIILAVLANKRTNYLVEKIEDLDDARSEDLRTPGPKTHTLTAYLGKVKRAQDGVRTWRFTSIAAVLLALGIAIISIVMAVLHLAV